MAVAFALAVILFIFVFGTGIAVVWGAEDVFEFLRTQKGKK